MNAFLSGSIVVKEYAVVKENDSSKPDIHEVDDKIDNLNKDCRKRLFLSFVYRCVYEFNFTTITKNEEVVSKINLGYMEFKSKYDGLYQKTKMF